MLRSLLLTMLCLALLSPTANGATACVPSWAMSTTPTTIWLVGSSRGVPDARHGQFKVVVRDLANNPLNGASVVIDLSYCPDLAICADQMDPDAMVNCAAKTIRKFTNAQGEATFTVLGHSTGAADATTLAGGARIYANGTLIGQPTAAAFDLDGSGGVGAGDLSVWLADFGSGEPFGRSDFDGSASVGAADLSDWLDVFGSGESAQSCATSRP
jgi:pimeloyl-ACP methyl ester carboxylesterase